jgi:hypothetical protein
VPGFTGLRPFLSWIWIGFTGFAIVFILDLLDLLIWNAELGANPFFSISTKFDDSPAQSTFLRSHLRI